MPHIKLIFEKLLEPDKKLDLLLKKDIWDIGVNKL